MSDSHARRRDWEQRYDEGRTAWDRGDVSPALVRWLGDGVVSAGRVLVPGAGYGHEVAALVRHGCQVTAVDIATHAVEHLRARLAADDLAADVVQADLLEWRPGAPFDAVYEQTCLCALDPGDRAQYEQRLWSWLRPGGALLALFMQTGQGGGPPFDCPLDAMRALFDDARWRWPAEEPASVPHPIGFVERGVVLTRR